MKKGIIIILLFIGTFFWGVALSQELKPLDPIYASLLNKSLRPCFKAMKKGDIDTIKKYISGDLYEKSRILLEQNKDYPKFLRNYYKNATFNVKHVEKINDEIFVEIEIIFENGFRNYHRLVYKIESENSSANWKGIRQIQPIVPFEH